MPAIQPEASTQQQVAKTASTITLEEFTVKIRNECITGSGIDPELFESAIAIVEDIELSGGNDAEAPIHEALNWKFTRFTHQVRENLFAALFKNADGSCWQAKLSKPIFDKTKQKARKYETPTGNGLRAYLPKVPASICKKIADRYGLEVPESYNFWAWVKAHPEIVIILTEGGKKALSLLSRGYVAIALYGCNGGVITKDDQGEKLTTPQLIPDLEEFATDDRAFVLAFDQDEKPETKRIVGAALKKLKQCLLANGCASTIAKWNGSAKGVDDLIVMNGGGEAWDASYAEAIKKLEVQFADPDDGGRGKKIPPEDVIGAEIANENSGRLIWNDEHKIWKFYNHKQPGIWSSVNDHGVEILIQSSLAAKGIKGWGSNSYIVNIRKFISRHLVTLEWKEREGILPFEDGVVNIATGIFEEHSPENHLTWCLPRKYNEPLINDWGNIRNWLNEAWSNPADVMTILCFFAAVIRGRHDLQKFLYLVGTGGSGKGTLTRLLQAVLGDRNTWAGKIENLADKNDCARLVGKRLAVFADQDKVTSGLQFFKNLTGGDYLPAKQLYKDTFDFLFVGLAVLTANAPALLGAGSWMKRRGIVVNCSYQPLVERNLDVLFQPELAAFTRYLLSISNEQIDKVLKDDRPTSGAVTPAYWDVAQRQDSIAAWIEECVVFQEGAFTQVGKNKDEWTGSSYDPTISTLFGSYHNYCRGAGLQGKSLNNFAPELEELCQKVLGYKFVTRERSMSVRGFRGIRLRRENDPRLSDSLCQPPADQMSTSGQPPVNFYDNLKPLQDKDFDNLTNFEEKSICKKSNKKNVENSQIENFSQIGGVGRHGFSQDDTVAVVPEDDSQNSDRLTSETKADVTNQLSPEQQQIDIEDKAEDLRAALEGGGSANAVEMLMSGWTLMERKQVEAQLTDAENQQLRNLAG
jgi:putative DNA primase/helicase